jgi:hypothetical protein
VLQGIIATLMASNYSLASDFLGLSTAVRSRKFRKRGSYRIWYKVLTWNLEIPVVGILPLMPRDFFF